MLGSIGISLFLDWQQSKWCINIPSTLNQSLCCLWVSLQEKNTVVTSDKRTQLCWITACQQLSLQYLICTGAHERSGFCPYLTILSKLDRGLTSLTFWCLFVSRLRKTLLDFIFGIFIAFLDQTRQYPVIISKQIIINHVLYVCLVMWCHIMYYFMSLYLLHVTAVKHMEAKMIQNSEYTKDQWLEHILPFLLPDQLYLVIFSSLSFYWFNRFNWNSLSYFPFVENWFFLKFICHWKYLTAHSLMTRKINALKQS